MQASAESPPGDCLSGHTLVLLLARTLRHQMVMHCAECAGVQDVATRPSSGGNSWRKALGWGRAAHAAPTAEPPAQDAREAAAMLRVCLWPPPAFSVLCTRLSGSWKAWRVRMAACWRRWAWQPARCQRM